MLAYMGNQKHFFSYLAGFIDGEGCITFSIGKRNKSYYAKDSQLKCPEDMFYLLPSIQITNVSLEVLEYIRDGLGYGRIFKKIKKKKKNHRAQYRLYFCRQKEILELLRSIRPYLHIKTKQAELMIEYCRRRIKEGRGRAHTYKPRDKELALLVQALNQGFG